MLKKKPVLATLLILPGLAGAAYFVEQRLRFDPTWAPPAIQIRMQVRQLTRERDATVEPDDVIGFSFPASLQQDVKTLDFEFVRQLDSRGFPNNREWPERADIVVIGDSLAMGVGVGVENGFVSQIDRALPDKTVVNLSLPGAGLERQARILDRFDDELRPGLIVSCLYLASDLLNDVQFHAWLENSLGKTFNDYRLSYGKRQSRKNSSKWARKLNRRGLYHWLLSKIEPGLPGKLRFVHSSRMHDGQLLMFDRHKFQFAKRKFSGKEVEFQQLRSALERIVELAAKNSAGLVVLLLPSKEEIYAPAVDSRADSALAQTRAELSSQGVEYLDLYEVLRESDTTPFYTRDIHFNRHGNNVVADSFVNWLRERGKDAWKPNPES